MWSRWCLIGCLLFAVQAQARADNPVVPILSIPANEAEVYTNTPQFAWYLNQSGNGLGYELEYINVTAGEVFRDASDQNGTGTVVAGLNAMHHTPTTDLVPGKTYQWRVRSQENVSGDYSDWSSVITFYTRGPGTVTIPLVSTPGDGTTVYTNTPQFAWYLSRAGNDLSYELEYINVTAGEVFRDASDQNGTGTVIPAIGTLHHVPTTPLIPGKTYQWRVRSQSDLTSEYSDWSAIASFYTNGPGRTVTPIPSWPIGDALVYTNTPQFSWYLGEGASGISYELEFVEQGQPFVCGDLVACGSAVTGIPALSYVPATPLTPAKTYTWRVRSQSTVSGEYSDWSATQTFQTNGPGTPTTPILSYPTDGVTMYSTAPRLSWYTNSGIAGLDFVVSYRAQGAPAWTVEPPTTGRAYQLSGLTPGTTYEWKAEARNAADPSQSLESNVETFVIAGGVANSVPVLSWPIASAEVYTTTPTLSWYLNGSPLGIEGYEITLADNSSFTSSQTAVVAGVSTTSYAVANALDWATTYYWRVTPCESVSGATCTNTVVPQASSTGVFATAGQTGSLTPILSNPTNEAVTPTTTVTFSWYVNGSLLPLDHYELQYSLTQSFDDPNFASTVTPLTAQQHVVADLLPGATYHWRVKACTDVAGTSCSASATRTFVTPAGTHAVQPATGSPVAGVRLRTASPTLSWFTPTVSQSALTYELEYGRRPDLSDATVLPTITNAQAELANLAPGRYYWRVRSQNAAGEYSLYSPIGVFETLTATSMDAAGEELPQTAVLHSNYPNPFNPSTTITYEVASAMPVAVRVYDLLGRHVQTLVDGVVSAGRHTVTWDGRDAAQQTVASGVYIYRLETQGQTESRTMLLLK